MEGWDPDLRGGASFQYHAFFSVTLTVSILRHVALLSQLITRSPTQPVPRPTPDTLVTHSFFNSLPISTLNFLERSNFASKSREEKIAFMKGLTGVLPRFSKGLRERKILGALLEEVCATFADGAFHLFSYHFLPAADEGSLFITIYTTERFQHLQ
jgi:hypothetical protein